MRWVNEATTTLTRTFLPSNWQGAFSLSIGFEKFPGVSAQKFPDE